MSVIIVQRVQALDKHSSLSETWYLLFLTDPNLKITGIGACSQMKKVADSDPFYELVKT